MAELATLGIEAKATGVDQAAKAMDRLTGAAQRVEAATDAIGVTSSKAGAIAAQAANAHVTALNAEAAAATQTAGAVRIYSAANQNAISSVTKLTASQRSLSGQTGNIASQLNDIGVQLASGTSPWLIALQQGTQLNQIFGGQGLRGILGGLGSAFAAVVSPVSLLTIGLIAAGGAAIQYFSNLLSSGPSAEETLKKQQDLLDRTAKAWGDAVPALQAYVDQLERARNVGDLKDVLAERTSSTLADIKASLEQFSSDNSDIIGILNISANSAQAPLHDLGVAYVGLQQKVAAGLATAEDFQRVQGQATKAAATTGFEEIGTFSTAFDTLAGSVRGALAVLAQFGTQAGNQLNTAASLQTDIQNRTTAASQTFVDENGQPRAVRDFVPGTPAVPEIRPSTESMFPGGTWKKPKAAKAAGADGYANSIQSMQARTKAIEAETSAQAALNPLINDYGFSVAKARASADLLNAAEKEKKAITPELNAQINATATALAGATAAQNMQTEATKRAKEAMNDAKDATNGFLSDLRAGLQNGEGLWKSFGDAALNVLDKIVDKLQDDLVNALFSANQAGGGGGVLGFLGKLFGGGSSFKVTPGAGLFASGGYTGNGAANQAAGIVHGGEYVFSKKATSRIGVGNLEAMHNRAKGYASGGYVSPVMPSANQNSMQTANTQRIPIDINVSVDDDGKLVVIAKQAGAEAGAQQADTRVKTFSKKELPDRMNEIKMNPRKR
ncbi:phage tail length tape measure family protein [Phyllobacterium ifriqiyense]|uniref:phage tail length tape measure family protein n=1 Tax=Phyllobacterium ifriqiyense TaxID=314238 RepID=UPI0033921EFB